MGLLTAIRNCDKLIREITLKFLAGKPNGTIVHGPPLTEGGRAAGAPYTEEQQDHSPHPATPAKM